MRQTTARRCTSSGRSRARSWRPRTERRVPRRARHGDAARAATPVRKVAILSTASGNGKTTVGRSSRHGSPSPSTSWTRSPRAELDGGHARGAAGEGRAHRRLGGLGDRRGVPGEDRRPRARGRRPRRLARPALRVWLPRLLRRTVRRIVTREELWTGTARTLRLTLDPRYSVVVYARPRLPETAAALRVRAGTLPARPSPHDGRGRALPPRAPGARPELRRPRPQRAARARSASET